MQKRDFLKTLALSGLAAGAGAFGARIEGGGHTASITKTKDIFETILKRGTLRCGYVVYAPNFMRDPNTGKFSGIFYDLMEPEFENRMGRGSRPRPTHRQRRIRPARRHRLRPVVEQRAVARD